MGYGWMERRRGKQIYSVESWIEMICKQIPGRAFLDSSTIQYLHTYGEYIFDGAEIAHDNQIWSVPNGFQNLTALQQIMQINNRGSLQFALSNNSLKEIYDRGNNQYTQWARELMEYWENCLANYEDFKFAFTGKGAKISKKIEEKRFGYLSKKDSILIRDAVILECDVFLTMEDRLPRNTKHLEQELEIKVIQPITYWNLLRPWAMLLG